MNEVIMRRKHIWLIVLVALIYGALIFTGVTLLQNQVDKSAKIKFLIPNNETNITIHTPYYDIVLDENGLDGCQTSRSATSILCGLDETDESCWKYKKEFYVDNRVDRGGCSFHIDKENVIVCDTTAIGKLNFDEDEEETISFIEQEVKCYFLTTGGIK